MMSGVPLKTCWTLNKLWNNKSYYKVASCWLLLLMQLTCVKIGVAESLLYWSGENEFLFVIFSFGCVIKDLYITLLIFQVLLKKTNTRNSALSLYTQLSSYAPFVLDLPFPILRRTSSDSIIFQFYSDVGRCPTRFLLRFFARCRSLSEAFPHVVRTLANR
jgi:hypothetical protein